MAAAAAATASRRYLPSLLTRHLRSLLLPSTSLATPKPRPQPLRSSPPTPFFPGSARHFCSKREESDPEEDESDEEGEEEEEESYEEGTSGVSSRLMDRSGKTEAERKAEAEEIGYRVVGPLELTENPFKPYEPVFAVVQVGSHQFKVSNGDSIFTERLKFCDVNDKLVLNKILMLGSTTQTVIGRPTLPDAAVHAVVEEHALDAKVIIFKKKRRKNYRRTKGHRQELTKLRITDIQGIEKPTNVPVSA